MRNIVSIRFGSHLYGTATPASDLDIKSVHVPCARDILLGRAKGSISTKRAKAEGEKNYAGELDEESYSLQKYLGLLAEGQTVALDVFFATPESMLAEPSQEWREIVENKDRLLTRKSASFVGYCRTQANKYGIKGSRVAAARAALALLDDAVSRIGAQAKLREIADDVRGLAVSTEHMGVVPIEQASGAIIDHFDVCGRKLSFSASIKHGRDVVAKLVAEYGARALMAEKQEGVDWKALSHAVRVGTQAIELLQTAHVTFPLPNAAHILAIKTGQLPYQAVAEEIEALLELVEAEAVRSPLRDEPDREWIDNYISRIYAKDIVNSPALR